MVHYVECVLSTVNTRHVHSHCMMVLNSSRQKLAKDSFSVKEHHKTSLTKSRMGITSSFSFFRKSPVQGLGVYKTDAPYQAELCGSNVTCNE